MDKFFNTAGPNQPDIHYTLQPQDRVNWPELSGLIDARKYFVLHAPHQTGKTSLLISLMHTITTRRAATGRCTSTSRPRRPSATMC
ncbi:MAG: hypothetical protein OHK0048_22050 [Rhodoferax sp.]